MARPAGRLLGPQRSVGLGPSRKLELWRLEGFRV